MLGANKSLCVGTDGGTQLALGSCDDSFAVKFRCVSRERNGCCAPNRVDVEQCLAVAARAQLNTRSSSRNFNSYNNNTAQLEAHDGLCFAQVRTNVTCVVVAVCLLLTAVAPCRILSVIARTCGLANFTTALMLWCSSTPDRRKPASLATPCASQRSAWIRPVTTPLTTSGMMFRKARSRTQRLRRWTCRLTAVTS